jgi:uncharacterized repeat protein (TIGR03803 family)
MASANEPTIQQLFSFPCPAQQIAICPLGYDPNILIQASDGNFYGAAQVTTEGTSNPQGGALFKITPRGQYTLLFTFAADKNGNYLNGSNPAGSLVEANDGFLYGTTPLGGAANDGVLFRIDKNGKNFEVLHNFCSEANCADGGGAGIILGQDGRLYGTTAFGGDSGFGTIFRFTPPSTLTPSSRSMEPPRALRREAWSKAQTETFTEPQRCRSSASPPKANTQFSPRSPR